MTIDITRKYKTTAALTTAGSDELVLEATVEQPEAEVVVANDRHQESGNDDGGENRADDDQQRHHRLGQSCNEGLDTAHARTKAFGCPPCPE